MILTKKYILDFQQSVAQLTNDEEIFIDFVRSEIAAFIEINTCEVPDRILKFILLEIESGQQNQGITPLMDKLDKTNLTVPKMDRNLWDFNFRKLEDFIELYQTLNRKEFNVDYNYNGRRTPAKLILSLQNATKYEPKHLLFQINLKIQHQIDAINWKLNLEQLKILRISHDPINSRITLREVLQFFTLYEQQESLEAYKLQLNKAIFKREQHGKKFLSSGIGIIIKEKRNNGNLIFSSINLGNSQMPGTCIIEGVLERDTEDIRRIDHSILHVRELPYVRVFSLLLKKYVYAHIEDITEYEYDTKAFQKLILPETIKVLLQSIFSFSIDKIYGDFINTKHGGIIVMAEGNPGTGKTSTAEVYAELNQKPLYSIQAYELGTHINSIEENLAIIFKRVEKWGAIILFDEVDVFLSKRDHDMEKSAIIGIFLRLMDYFRGIMFFTTNRSDVIDHAVLSRITLNVKYPDLTNETRLAIWKSKLEDAQIEIDGLEELCKIELNGRNIRNMVRLAGIVYGNKIEEKKLIELIYKSVANISEKI